MRQENIPRDLDAGAAESLGIFFMELSEKLFKKWQDLMIRKYGYANPTRPEVLDFAEDLTRYFQVIIEDDMSQNNL